MVGTRSEGEEVGSVRSGTFSYIHLAIGVGMVASSRFAWLYSHAETDTSPPALALFLCELPFLFCLFPFITGETPKRNIKSAGMLFGTALSFCPVLLPLQLDAQLTAWGRRGYLAELASFLPVCFIAAMCMLAVSWSYRRADRTEFMASAKKGVLGFLLVSLLFLLASVWGRV
jgi:hypothetical protein